MPVFAWLILALLLLPCALSFTVFGKNLSGWAWVGAYMVTAVTFAARGFSRGAMPLWFWMPWAVLVVAYMFGPHDYSVQNAAQMLCPLFVGYVASTFGLSSVHLEALALFMRRGALIFLGILLFLRLPMLLIGILPAVTGLAPESISALFFQSFFLCLFILRRQRTDLLLYLACAAVPVVAVTRGPIAASFLLATLCLAPLSMKRRCLIGALAVSIGLLVFYSGRFQDKMFRSGEGSVQDITQNSDDVQLSGRGMLQEMMLAGIREHPWTGNGGNATWTMLKDARMELEQPHNDWLRIIYNYGFLGLVLYLGAVLMQVWHTWRSARYSPPLARILFYSAASAFVPYAAIMYTDNVLIYAQFFGNLHFLMLGLAYGCLEAHRAKWMSDRARGIDPRHGLTRPNLQPHGE
jgi:O-antigen ligase